MVRVGSFLCVVVISLRCDFDAMILVEKTFGVTQTMVWHAAAFWRAWRRRKKQAVR